MVVNKIYYIVRYIISMLADIIKSLIIYWFPFIALILSAIAFSYTYHAKNSIQFESGVDGYNLLVTILSILVTVLMAWNIYTIIDIKSLSNRLDEFRKDINRQIDLKINSFNRDSAKDMGVIASITMVVSSSKVNETDSLKTIIEMYKEVMCNEKSFALVYCMDVIKCIIENDIIYHKIDKKRLLINISIETLKNLQIHTIKYFTDHKKIDRVSELLFMKIDK